MYRENKGVWFRPERNPKPCLIALHIGDEGKVFQDAKIREEINEVSGMEFNQNRMDLCIDYLSSNNLFDCNAEIKSSKRMRISILQESFKSGILFCLKNRL